MTNSITDNYYGSPQVFIQAMALKFPPQIEIGKKKKLLPSSQISLMASLMSSLTLSAPKSSNKIVPSKYAPSSITDTFTSPYQSKQDSDQSEGSEDEGGPVMTLSGDEKGAGSSSSEEEQRPSSDKSYFTDVCDKDDLRRRGFPLSESKPGRGYDPYVDYEPYPRNPYETPQYRRWQESRYPYYPEEMGYMPPQIDPRYSEPYGTGGVFRRPPGFKMDRRRTIDYRSKYGQQSYPAYNSAYMRSGPARPRPPETMTRAEYEMQRMDEPRGKYGHPYKGPFYTEPRRPYFPKAEPWARHPYGFHPEEHYSSYRVHEKAPVVHKSKYQKSKSTTDPPVRSFSSDAVEVIDYSREVPEEVPPPKPRHAAHTKHSIADDCLVVDMNEFRKPKPKRKKRLPKHLPAQEEISIVTESSDNESLMQYPTRAVPFSQFLVTPAKVSKQMHRIAAKQKTKRLKPSMLRSKKILKRAIHNSIMSDYESSICGDPQMVSPDILNFSTEAVYGTSQVSFEEPNPSPKRSMSAPKAGRSFSKDRKLGKGSSVAQKSRGKEILSVKPGAKLYSFKDPVDDQRFLPEVPAIFIDDSVDRGTAEEPYEDFYEQTCEESDNLFDAEDDEDEPEKLDKDVDAVQDENLEEYVNYAEMEEESALESESEDNQGYGFEDDEVVVLSDSSEKTASVVNPFAEPETEDLEEYERVSGDAAQKSQLIHEGLDDDPDIVKKMHSGPPFKKTQKSPKVSKSKKDIHEDTKDLKKSQRSKESGSPTKMQTNKIGQITEMKSKVSSDTPREVLNIINVKEPNFGGFPKRKYRSAKAKEKASKELPVESQNQAEVLANDGKEGHYTRPKTLKKQKSPITNISPMSKTSLSPKSSKSKFQTMRGSGGPEKISQVDHEELCHDPPPSGQTLDSTEQIESHQPSVPVRIQKLVKARLAVHGPNNNDFGNSSEIGSKIKKFMSAKSKLVENTSVEELEVITDDKVDLESSPQRPEIVPRVKKYKAAKPSMVQPEEPHSANSDDEHATENGQVDHEMHEHSIPQLKDVLNKKITVPCNYLNSIVLPVVVMRRALVHTRTIAGEPIYVRAIRTQIKKEKDHIVSIKVFADPYNFSDDESVPSVKSSLGSSSDSEIRYSLVEPKDLPKENSHNIEMEGEQENSSGSSRQIFDDASDILGHLSSSDEDSNTLYSLAEDAVEFTDDLENKDEEIAENQSETYQSNQEEAKNENEMDVQQNSEENNKGNQNGVKFYVSERLLQSVPTQEPICSKILRNQKSDETKTSVKGRKRRKSKENTRNSSASPNLQKSPTTSPKSSKKGRQSGSKVTPEVLTSDINEPVHVKKKRGRPRKDRSLTSPGLINQSTSSELGSVQSIKMSIPKSSMSEKTTRALDKFMESSESTASDTVYTEEDQPGTPELFADAEDLVEKDQEITGHNLDEEIQMDEKEQKASEKSSHDSLMKPQTEDLRDFHNAEKAVSIETDEGVVQDFATKSTALSDSSSEESEELFEQTSLDESTAKELQKKKQCCQDQEENQSIKDAPETNKETFESGNVVEVHSGFVEDVPENSLHDGAGISKSSLHVGPKEPKLKSPTISKSKSVISCLKADVTGKQPSTSTPKFFLNQHQCLQTGLADISEESSSMDEGSKPISRGKVKWNKKFRRDVLKKSRNNSSKDQASTSKSESNYEAPIADTISDISSISSNSFVQKNDSLSITGVQYMSSSMEDEEEDYTLNDDGSVLCVMDPPTFIKSSTDTVKKAADSTSDLGKVRTQKRHVSARELQKQANDHWKKIAQGPSSLYYDMALEKNHSNPIDLTDVTTKNLPSNGFQLISSFESFDPNLDEVTSQQKIQKGAHEIEDILENMSSLLDTLYGQKMDSDSDEDIGASRNLVSSVQNKISDAEEVHNSFSHIPDEERQTADACVGSDLDQATAVADQRPPLSDKEKSQIKSPRIAKSITPQKSASPLPLQKKLDQAVKSPAVKKLNLSDPQGQSKSKPSPIDESLADSKPGHKTDPQTQFNPQTDSEAHLEEVEAAFDQITEAKLCPNTGSQAQEPMEDTKTATDHEHGQLDDESDSRTLSISDSLLSYTQMNETTQKSMDKSLNAQVVIEPLEKKLIIDGIVWKRKGSIWKSSSSNLVKTSLEISQFLKDMRQDAKPKDSSTKQRQASTSTKELTEFERAISSPKNLVKKVRKIRIKRLPIEESETYKIDNASTKATSPEKIKWSPRKATSPQREITSPKKVMISPKKVTILKPKSPSPEIQAPTSKLAQNILKKKQIEAEKLQKAEVNVVLELPGSFESILSKKSSPVKATKHKPKFDSNFKIPSKKNLAEGEESEFVSPLEKGYQDDSTTSFEFQTNKSTSLLQSGRSVMEKSGFVFGDTKIIRSPFARKSTASAETSIPIFTSKVRNSPHPEGDFQKEKLLKNLESAFSSKPSKSFTFGASFSFDQKSSEAFSTSLGFLNSNSKPLSVSLLAEEKSKCPVSPSGSITSTSSRSTISSVNKITVKRKLIESLGTSFLSSKKLKLSEASSSTPKYPAASAKPELIESSIKSAEKPLCIAKSPRTEMSLSKSSLGTDFHISKTKSFGSKNVKLEPSVQIMKKLDTPKSKSPSRPGSRSILKAEEDESAFMTIDQTGFESKLASSLEEGELRDSMLGSDSDERGNNSDEEAEINSESESIDDTSHVSSSKISDIKGSNSLTAKPEKNQEGSSISKENEDNDEMMMIRRLSGEMKSTVKKVRKMTKTKRPKVVWRPVKMRVNQRVRKRRRLSWNRYWIFWKNMKTSLWMNMWQSNEKETKKKKPAILDDDLDESLSEIKVPEDQDKTSDLDLDPEVGNSPESSVKEQPGPPLIQNPLKMIPKSYCFNYVRDPNSCRNTDCHFKHQRPSKEECTQHISNEIHVAIKENRPKDAVDYFMEFERAGYGIIHHYVKPVLFCCYQLGFTYTPIAHNLLGVLFNLELLDADICDGFIQCCSVKRREFSKLLWEIFEVIQSLNIQPTPESILTLLMTFYECKFVKELFEVMIYSNELDFTIPLIIRNFALTEALNNPAEYFTYAVKWVQQTNEEFLLEFDHKMLEQLINMFSQSKQMELVETLNVIRVRKLRLKDEAPQIEEPEIDREEARIQAATNFDTPELQKEEKTSHAHRIQGCKLSYNWEYLAQIFLDLCGTSWPRNTDYIDLYIDTLTSPKTETKILEAFKKFLEKLQEIVKVERNHNVLLEFDTRSLSQICCGIIQFCCNKHYYITGFNILEQLIQYDIKICSRSPHTIHEPLLNILEICNQVSIPLAAVRVLEDLKWLKYNQETVKDVDKYGHILDDLIVKSVSKKLNYQAFQLLSFLIHILESGGRDVEELSSLKAHFNEIVMSSLSKGVVEPALKTFQLDREKHRKKHLLTPITLRSLFAALYQIGDIENTQRVFNYAMAREDIYITQENRRQIVIGSNLTFGEIDFQIRHYLLQMYRLFCNKTMSGEVLSFDELKISIILKREDCANVPFLSTAAPQCQYAALELIKLSLANLNPPISYHQRFTAPMNGGIFFLNPTDVQKYMHTLDSQEIKQGLRFTPSSSQCVGRTSGPLLPRHGYPDRNRFHFSGHAHNVRQPRFQPRSKSLRWN
ncbi:hypothetical protein LOTGIDRAFT_233840 [Lottia gigantea]|uniref:Uncharacterized protein n=1 Tax=Lottia gigantea TaxID=225164 RepID=V4AAN9_LOTGI|nr:hypothetical protein LOTGIDRAFT_233840 [Lottia gigantea]ESO90346.1 hypothetical protein LOTGIDRAFT_233840 [Lottia gigantea]